jgi:beta-N-acetylhexosaminidase
VAVGGELDRRAHAVLVPGFEGSRAPRWLLSRVERGLGGAVLFARNVRSPEQVAELAGSLRAVGPDVLLAVDEEGGDVTRLEARTGSRHPAALALGRIDDVVLTRRVASSIGALVGEAGLDWCWAPVADVVTEPRSAAIGVRSYGGDADLVARHVAATVTGLQDDAGIAACTKHFPGHGDVIADSHRESPVVEATLGELRERALVPFEAALAAGVRSMMTGHLLVRALDAHAPATVSRRVVQGLLREELGYRGVVVSDALEMGALTTSMGIDDAAVLALESGVDALCLGGSLAEDAVVELTVRAIVDAVRSGRLSEDRLVEAGERVARLAAWRAVRRRAAPALGPLTSEEAQQISASAVEVVGDVRVGQGELVVISCEPAHLVASGGTGASVADRIAARRPDARVLHVDGEPSCPVPPGLDRSTVLVVRDVARHGWQRSLWRDVARRRPGVVVVDTGVPADPGEPARGLVTTFGLSAPTAEHVAALLLDEETR